MITKRRETGFTRFARRFFVVVLASFIVGFVWLTSYESALNIKTQSVEKEIAIIESDIDGLTMKKQELASFIDDLVQKNNDGLIDDFIYENVMKRVKEQEKLIYILCVIKSFN